MLTGRKQLVVTVALPHIVSIARACGVLAASAVAAALLTNFLCDWASGFRRHHLTTDFAAGVILRVHVDVPVAGHELLGLVRRQRHFAGDGARHGLALLADPDQHAGVLAWRRGRGSAPWWRRWKARCRSPTRSGAGVRVVGERRRAAAAASCTAAPCCAPLSTTVKVCGAAFAVAAANPHPVAAISTSRREAPRSFPLSFLDFYHSGHSLIGRATTHARPARRRCASSFSRLVSGLDCGRGNAPRGGGETLLAPIAGCA